MSGHGGELVEAVEVLVADTTAPRTAYVAARYDRAVWLDALCGADSHYTWHDLEYDPPEQVTA